MRKKFIINTMMTMPYTTMAFLESDKFKGEFVYEKTDIPEDSPTFAKRNEPDTNPDLPEWCKNKNWSPYCLKCSTINRMSERAYGFQCESCRNKIDWYMKRYEGDDKRSYPPIGTVGTPNVDRMIDMAIMTVNAERRKKEQPPIILYEDHDHVVYETPKLKEAALLLCETPKPYKEKDMNLSTLALAAATMGIGDEFDRSRGRRSHSMPKSIDRAERDKRKKLKKIAKASKRKNR